MIQRIFKRDSIPRYSDRYQQKCGRILGRKRDKSLRSFPPCYSQSPLLTDFETVCNVNIVYVNLKSENSQYYVQKLKEIVRSWIRLLITCAKIPVNTCVRGYRHLWSYLQRVTKNHGMHQNVTFFQSKPRSHCRVYLFVFVVMYWVYAEWCKTPSILKESKNCF